MLLRCVDTDRFVLPDGQPLTALQLAAQLGRTAAAQPGRRGTSEALHLLLPAARCLVTTVPVAPHEIKLLHKTLPWMLEERLLEPVEQVHVASGPVQSGSAAVSALDGAWLKQVLDTLSAAGLQPRSARADVLVLPWQQGQWTVFLAADDKAPALVRHGAHAGFACARSNLRLALQLLLNESAEPPAQFHVYAEPGVDVNAAEAFPDLLQARLELKRQSWWQSVQAERLPVCDLLQGRFAPPLPWADWWRQWRAVAALLVALLVSDLVAVTLHTGRLQRQTLAGEAELVRLYRSVQPDGVVVDPRAQLEQVVAALGGSTSPGFLTLLTRMAPALAASPDAVVQSLEYSASTGDLHLQVVTAGFAAAESLRVRLQGAGLEAELLGSSSDGAQSRTRLRVGS